MTNLFTPETAESAPPFPPKELMFMGETEAQAVANGDRLLGLADGLYDENGLVLDISGGYGRLAYALHRRHFAGSEAR